MRPAQLNTVDVHVGGRLRAMRRQRGMSQQAMAAGVDLSFQQAQKYERGANRISASKLYELAGVLGCTIADFFEGLPDPGTGAPLPGSVVSRVDNVAGLPGGVDLLDAFIAMPTRLRAPFVSLARGVSQV